MHVQFLLGDNNPLLQSTNPFFSLPNSNKMHLIEDLISDHFIKLGAAQVLEDEEMNELTLKKLSILVRFQIAMSITRVVRLTVRSLHRVA